jgi:hypothetical protein
MRRETKAHARRARGTTFLRHHATIAADYEKGSEPPRRLARARVERESVCVF